MSTVHETTLRAQALGLTFSQTQALEWCAEQHAPFFGIDYRKAGITPNTMSSLIKRGLVTFGSDACGAIYSATKAGRDAIAKAQPGTTQGDAS